VTPDRLFPAADLDACEIFNALPSPLASHYGQRAEEIESTLRARGILPVFDMPGEGFTLETLAGDPLENPPADLADIVRELETIATA